MKVKDAFTKGRPAFSFEFFPPKTDKQENQLYEVAAELKKFNPDFVSVTYSPGGKTADKSFAIVKNIKEKCGIEPVAHLTCIGENEAGILPKLKKLNHSGIKNILALRGDLPQNYLPANLKYARDLIILIKNYLPDFCLGAAGYPEKHPEAQSFESDILHLKEKVAGGVDYIITQLFFENDLYFKFAEKCQKAGIAVPIIPGIMPISSLKQITRMTSTCGASIPKKILEKLASYGNDAESVKKFGAEIAIQQCRQLLKEKVLGLHFFVLNRAEPISTILKNI